MGGKRLAILTASAFFLFIAPVFASAAVGVSPAGASTDILQGGSKVQTITVQRSGDLTKSLAMDVRFRGDLAEHFTGEKSIFFPKGDAVALYEFSVSAVKLDLGEVTGLIDFLTSVGDLPQPERGKSVIVHRSGVTFHLSAQVTNRAVEAFDIHDVSIPAIEEGDMLSVLLTAENTGNISWRPDGITMDVFNDVGERVVRTSISGETIEPVRPGSADVRTFLFGETLKAGSYKAVVDVLSGGEAVFSHREDFSVLPAGSFNQQGDLQFVTSNKRTYSAFEQPVIFGVFENTGDTAYTAAFVVNVFRNNRLVRLTRSEEVRIRPGEEKAFRQTFQPIQSGEYRIVALVEYGHNVTPPKKIEVMVNGEGLPGIFWVLIGLLVVAVSLWLIVRYEERSGAS